MTVTGEKANVNACFSMPGKKIRSTQREDPDFLCIAAGGEGDGFAVGADAGAGLAVAGEGEFHFAVWRSVDQFVGADGVGGREPFGDAVGGTGGGLAGLVLPGGAVEIDVSGGRGVEVVAFVGAADFGF